MKLHERLSGVSRMQETLFRGVYSPQIPSWRGGGWLSLPKNLTPALGFRLRPFGLAVDHQLIFTILTL